MDWSFLLHSEGPHHHVLAAEAEALTDHLRAFALGSEGAPMVRWLRGSQMHTPGELLNEFAAALQFPPHFGRNWDALDECLNSLEWLDGEAAVLVLLEADEVLQEGESADIRILFDILSTEEANVPFHVLHQVEGNPQALLERLKALHIEADLIDF